MTFRVIVATWLMVPLPWYQHRLAAHGLAIDPHAPGPDVPPSVRVANQILATGRPLFVDAFQGNILKTFATYPYGMVFRVVPPGTPPPSLDDIIAINRDLYSNLHLDYRKPGPDDGYPREIAARYASVWAMLARELAAAGRRDDARDALALAEQLGPAR